MSLSITNSWRIYLRIAVARSSNLASVSFREEEWIDMDQEFFAVILDGIRLSMSYNPVFANSGLHR